VLFVCVCEGESVFVHMCVCVCVHGANLLPALCEVFVCVFLCECVLYGEYFD